MIMSYIKVPSCLILAVTPANLDLANSDALQMAGIADPDALKLVLQYCENLPKLLLRLLKSQELQLKNIIDLELLMVLFL
ncbi:uncharacterized protein [Arachis hypogaea]|uniref:uncharacterized protein n=2 Tax=Arachis TaxID=3817 RepID=UPI003B20F747